MAVSPASSRRSTLLSDDLLRQLIAAGQADIVVGVPTLDNATTIGPVVAAAQRAAAAMVGYRRVLVFNSDGGSTDGTQEIVAQATAGASVSASHSLRTIHRIIAPYHGLPGKRTAIRTVFAVADLLQARAALVVDPNAADPSQEAFAALLGPVLDDEAEVVALAADRDPREGPLVTQVVRPLITGALGASFDDPMGADLVVSRPRLGDMLAQTAWDDEAMRPGIDLWLRVHALMSGARTLQVAVGPRPTGPGSRLPLRDVVQQVLRAVWRSVDVAAQHLDGAAAHAPQTRRLSHGTTTEPDWDLTSVEQVFRDGARDLAPLWRTQFPGALVDAITTAATSADVQLPDTVWADALVEVTCSAPTHPRPDELASAFVPIYLGRVASFLREARARPSADVHARLDALSALVSVQRGRFAGPRPAPRHGGS